MHYRGVAPDRVDEVMAVVRILGQRHHLRVTGGRKVIELRPDVEWGKGRTIEWILEHIGGADLLLPMYIGDDLTDEDGFDAIRHKGVGIAVRSAETGTGGRQRASPSRVRRRSATSWGRSSSSSLSSTTASTTRG